MLDWSGIMGGYSTTDTVVTDRRTTHIMKWMCVCWIGLQLPVVSVGVETVSAVDSSTWPCDLYHVCRCGLQLSEGVETVPAVVPLDAVRTASDWVIAAQSRLKTQVPDLVTFTMCVDVVYSCQKVLRQYQLWCPWRQWGQPVTGSEQHSQDSRLKYLTLWLLPCVLMWFTVVRRCWDSTSCGVRGGSEDSQWLGQSSTVKTQDSLQVQQRHTTNTVGWFR